MLAWSDPIHPWSPSTGPTPSTERESVQDDRSWQTKSSDRFVLRWIKVNLSARVTPRLMSVQGLEPWMVTLFSAALGVLGGMFFALGLPFLAGSVAALGQVFDGVDGQFARLKKMESQGGAFWDSVLDRYADGAMMMGMIVYLVTLPAPLLSPWIIVFVGMFAVVGSNLISYSSARGEALGISLGPSTLASKGTRTSAMILSAWATIFWPGAPLAALLYLFVHTNLVIASRLVRTRRLG